MLIILSFSYAKMLQFSGADGPDHGGGAPLPGEAGGAEDCCCPGIHHHQVTKVVTIQRLLTFLSDCASIPPVSILYTFLQYSVYGQGLKGLKEDSEKAREI